MWFVPVTLTCLLKFRTHLLEGMKIALVDMKQPSVRQGKGNLSEDQNTVETQCVFLESMPPSILQCLEILQSSIQCFMTSSD
jgi:hypothetical protein